MKHNVGAADRMVRVILGVVLLLVGLLVPLGVVLRVVVFAIAGIALVTGLLGTCGIYALFGISTRKGE
jgi:hypothetical protein